MLSEGRSELQGNGRELDTHMPTVVPELHGSY